MKRIVIIIILIFNLFFIYADINNPPTIPDNIYGTIMINNESAEIGTLIIAKINNSIVGDYNIIETGQFGSETINNRFLISGYFLDIDKEINFFLIVDNNEILGETNPETITFLSGENQNFDLFFNYILDENTIPDNNTSDDLNIIIEDNNVIVPPLPPSNPTPNVGGGSGSGGSGTTNLTNIDTNINSNLNAYNNTIDNNSDTNTDLNLNYPYSKAEDSLNFPKPKKEKSITNIFKTEENNKFNYNYIFLFILLLLVISIIYIIYKRRKT